MLSSMTPSILAGTETLVAGIGSPWGRNMTNTVNQMVLNLEAHRMSIGRPVERPGPPIQWLPDG